MGKQAGLRALSVMTLTLSACATNSPARQVPNLSSAGLDRPDQLAPVKLAKGECGLFVWAGQSRRFIMFSRGQNYAVMSNGDQETSLMATNPDALPDYHGQYPTQSFIDTRGKPFDLSFNKVATLGNSIRYSQGSWRSEDDNGWERIEAAYGLSTCIPDGNLPIENSLSASRFDLLRPIGQGGNSDAIQTARMTFTPASFRKETTKVLSMPAVTQIARPAIATLPAPPPIETVKKQPIAREIVKAIVDPKAEFPQTTEWVPPVTPTEPSQSSPFGPYKIQLASYLNEDHAHAGWATLSSQYTSLSTFEPTIFPAQIKDKGLYFRLQVGGYKTHSMAYKKCQALKSEGLECFVTHKKF